MERSNFDWLESEIETAEILTHLHHTFSLFSHVPYSWPCRKKRSAIRNTPPSNGGGATTVLPPPPSNCGGATTAVVPPPPSNGGGATTVVVPPPSSNAVKVKVSSPTTPLSFPTTESDEKPKHSEKRTSLKRKKEHYLNIIQDLTKTKDSITQEIANVKRDCEQLKLVNFKLKAKGKELNTNGPKGEYKNPNLEINKPMKLNNSIIKNSVNTPNSTGKNEEHKIQMHNHHANSFGVDPTTSLGVASSSSSSMGRNSDNMGPLFIHDLNLSFEAIKDLSKVREAQARQRRIHILRLKKNNAKQHQSSSIR